MGLSPLADPFLSRIFEVHPERFSEAFRSKHLLPICVAQPYVAKVEQQVVVPYEPPPEPVRRPSCETILKVVAAETRVSIPDILSSRRYSDYVNARHYAMLLMKEKTLNSLPAIGRRLGGKDHTSVIHGIRRMQRLETTDAAHGETMNRLRRKVDASLQESA